MKHIPQASLAVIGGSGTFSSGFPLPSQKGSIQSVVDNAVFSTPFGPSPPLASFLLPDGRQVLTCTMHGWRPGVTRKAASQQLFWVFREAGVRRIIAEGGVGTTHDECSPGAFVVPDDYIDWSCRRDTSLGDDFLLIMRDPLCHLLRRRLADTAVKLSRSEVVEGGVYAVTDGRHFESRAEVRALSALGADVIGQSLVPEVYLAREIGACYAGLHQVVNRAEGVGEDWSHDELREIFHGRASLVAEILLETLVALPPHDDPCPCRGLRKKTLLRPPPPSPR